jgi:hypothetical protein
MRVAVQGHTWWLQMGAHINTQATTLTLSLMPKLRSNVIERSAAMSFASSSVRLAGSRSVSWYPATAAAMAAAAAAAAAWWLLEPRGRRSAVRTTSAAAASRRWQSRRWIRRTTRYRRFLTLVNASDQPKTRADPRSTAGARYSEPSDFVWVRSRTSTGTRMSW